MHFLKRFFGAPKENSTIVVSGLPRSGTSMMMQILQAGGVKLITDNVRLADENNVKGYYEHVGVKALAQGNTQCLRNSEGKAIKIVSPLLKCLPMDRAYKVIFMRRNMEEILASQAAMVENLTQQKSNTELDKKLSQSYLTHLQKTLGWLKASDCIELLEVNYSDTIKQPNIVTKKIARFLGMRLDTESMERAIDAGLMRQRHR